MSETPRSEQPEEPKELTNQEKLLDSVLSKEGDDPSISVANKEERQKEREELEGRLQKLSDREQQIIRLRYGLENGKTYTFKEIGKILNLSKGRVHQIEHKALWRIGIHRGGKDLENKEKWLKKF